MAGREGAGVAAGGVTSVTGLRGVMSVTGFFGFCGTAGAASGTVTVDRPRLLQLRQQLEAMMAALNRR